MKMRFLFFLVFVYGSFVSIAQVSNSSNETSFAQSSIQKKRQGDFYFLWGYTRCAYSTSDIHFVDHSNTYYPTTGKYHDYDFTIYDAKAKDRPDFDQIKDIINITIPQFVSRIGYYFNDKRDLGFEINYDHAKYVVTNYQKVRVKGSFNGQYVNKDTLLDPDTFLHFEHTDGANFWMFNFIKRWKVIEPSKNFNLGLIVKPGVGFVYPRTDVTMLGTRLNNRWHIAGWITGIEAGIRAEFLKYGVFEFTGNGSYANYTNVLVLGKGNGKSNHHFYTGQLTMTIGTKF
jgi:hypothetical protein